MKKEKLLGRRRVRRKYRVRKGGGLTPDRKRLVVTRSLKHISAQIVDELSGQVLCAASTAEKSVATTVGYGGNCNAASEVGRVIAERALGMGVKKVHFDRGSARYHGRIAALAASARNTGLDF